MVASPTPAVVICRDRLDYTKQCVWALLGSPDVADIHLVDHGSAWGPMLEWLGMIAGPVNRHAEVRGRVDVRRIHVHWQANAHPRDLWSDGTLASIVQPGERFVVTDCDVVAPSDWRGRDWLAQLHRILDADPALVKAGLQLRTDDLPEHNPDQRRIVEWEANYRQAGQLRRMAALSDQVAWYYAASLDTTLALYRRLEAYAIDPSARTSHPHHLARHLPWYENPETLSDELRHYYAHAEYGHWRQPEGFVDQHAIGG